MSLNHKAGSDSGVDYATVVVFLLWVVMAIILVALLVLRSDAEESHQPARFGCLCALNNYVCVDYPTMVQNHALTAALREGAQSRLVGNSGADSISQLSIE